MRYYPPPRLHHILNDMVCLLLTLSIVIFSQFCIAAPNYSIDRKGTGISLGSTRVIYYEKTGAASVRVINTSSSPFLVQTWVDNFQGSGGWEKPPVLATGSFVTIPPLFRLDKGENSIRINHASGSFPKDRESVFHLKVKTIPSVPKPAEGTNYVQFAFVNAIKMFWRPVGLKGNPDEAYKLLTFRRIGGDIEAVNPTPYHITIKRLKVGGREVHAPDLRMVPPFGSQRWHLPEGASGTVIYSTVNDFGALTQPLTVFLLNK